MKHSNWTFKNAIFNVPDLICNQRVIQTDYKVQIMGGGGGSNPIFAQDTPKFGFGDVKKWGKKYMEREGKSIRFNKLLYNVHYYHSFLHIEQDFSCTMTWLWLLAANVSPVTSMSTAHKNYWPL